MLLAFLRMICFRGKIVHNPLIKVGPWAAGREIKNYRTLRSPDYGQEESRLLLLGSYFMGPYF